MLGQLMGLSKENVDPRYWSLKEWKQIAWEVMVVDTLVSSRPAFIFALWISSEGTAEADAIVYDGQNASSLKLIHLDTVDESMAQLKFNPPLFFQKGIYVDVGSNVAQIGIQYLPLPVM